MKVIRRCLTRKQWCEYLTYIFTLCEIEICAGMNDMTVTQIGPRKRGNVEINETL